MQYQFQYFLIFLKILYLNKNILGSNVELNLIAEFVLHFNQWATYITHSGARLITFMRQPALVEVYGFQNQFLRHKSNYIIF